MGSHVQLGPESGAHAPADPEASGDDARRRILVIDDEQIITRVVERILSRQYLVVCCHSAADALPELEREPDVIVCDLMMPVLSGIELHAQLCERRPDLASRMVFVTGGTTSAAGRAFLARVPNRRLGKPFSAGELRAVVSEQLTGAQPSVAK